MSNFYIVTTACCALLLLYYALFPSTVVSDSDPETEMEISDLRMIDLCESMSDLYQKGLFSDLTLVIEEEFKVHKSILSARSQVFHQMLQSQKDVDKIVVEGISKEVANQMLLFIYTGHTEELSIKVAVELYAAADRYKLDLLRKLCSDFLEENLNLDNTIEVLSLSNKYYNEKLQKASVRFIVDNTLAIRQQSNWLEFIKTHPKQVDEVIGSLASKK